jgi:hypothetical protein
MSQPRSPLLHPVVLAMLGLLIFNDHWLKAHHPSWLSGKLSDIAFMVLAPLWLHTGYLLMRRIFLGESSVNAATSKRALLICMGGTAGFLIAMETTEIGDWTYEHLMGLLQWPYYALRAGIVSHSLPAPNPVRATPDVTDLLCLPVLWVAHRIGSSRPFVGEGGRGTVPAKKASLALVTTLVGAAALLQSPMVRAETESTRPLPADAVSLRGAFMRGGLGLSMLIADSEGSLLGPSERIPSNAQGAGLSLFAEAGFRSSQVAIAGRLELATWRELRVTTLGQTLDMENYALTAIMLGPAVVWWPWNGEKWYGELGVAYGALEPNSGKDLLGDSIGETHTGVWLSLQAGNEWRLSRRVRVGAAARFQYGHVGLDGNQTNAVAPGLCATVSWL